MDSMFSKIIQVIWLIILLLALLLSFLAPLAWAQGGGCPAATPLVAGQIEVLQTITAEPAIPENVTPQTEAQGVFHQNQVTIDYQGQQVWVIAPCVDDVLVITNLTTGQEWRHTYGDGQKILTITSPLDITSIFAPYLPGKQVLKISYVDMIPPYRSAAQVVILQVAGQPPQPSAPPPRPQPSTTDKGIPVFGSVGQPTDTPTPLPLLISTSIMTSTPTARAIAVAAVGPTPAVPDAVSVLSEAPSGSSSTLMSKILNSWPLSPLMWAGLATGLVLAALAVRTITSGRNRIPGELEKHQDGNVNRYVLADFGKSAVTIGSAGDILLTGAQILPWAARLRVEKERNEPAYAVRRHAVIEYLDHDGQVSDQRPLFHGDEFYISTTRFVYINYAEEEPILPIELEEDFNV